MAFEGNHTERIYFEALKESIRFKNDIIYLHLLNRQHNDTNSAPNHVFNKLKREASDRYNFEAQDELWMIIDKDKWKNIPQIVAQCDKLSNMHVALSNPCFELWLLLHIKNINDYKKTELEKITENKKNGNRTYLELKIIEILGAYNKSNPKPELYLPTVNYAIEQAKLLDSNLEDYPTGLGSHVYKLVDCLIQ